MLLHGENRQWYYPGVGAEEKTFGKGEPPACLKGIRQTHDSFNGWHLASNPTIPLASADGTGGKGSGAARAATRGTNALVYRENIPCAGILHSDARGALRR
jgi:hypothetical protein